MKTFRTRGTLAAAALLSVLTALAGCGASASSTSSLGGMQANPASTAAEMNPNLDLGSSLDSLPAPDIKLVNQFGQPMSLSQFRGKVVMLGFEDSECTTVCPLTTQSMLQAKQLLGAAGNQVQLLGVDANPDATSVADVLAYSRAHGMVNQWDFLTGSPAQLKSVWSAYHIAVQVEQGQIDHTPALFVIDQQGREQKLYLTQMAYSSVGQSAQVLADELSSLLPGHPHVASQESLASITVQGPSDHVALPSATGGTKVDLGPGSPHLVLFFATWLSEVSDLKSELIGANAYVAAARKARPAPARRGRRDGGRALGPGRPHLPERPRHPAQLPGRPRHHRPRRGRLQRAGPALAGPGLRVRQDHLVPRRLALRPRPDRRRPARPQALIQPARVPPNSVVVTTTSSGARGCGNHVVQPGQQSQPARCLDHPASLTGHTEP